MDLDTSESPTLKEPMPPPQTSVATTPPVKPPAPQAAVPAAVPSPSASSPSKHQLYLNSSLQQCLLLTLKKEEARGDIIYVSSLEDEMGGQDLVEDHLDRYIYEILSESSLITHPFKYLLDAHSRCHKESRSGREFVRKPAAAAAEQVARHAALLLTVPDFVPRSEGSVDVLAEALLHAGPYYADRSYFLQCVLACVSEQGAEMVDSVVSPFVDRILTVMKQPAQSTITEDSVNALKVLITTTAFKPAVLSITNRPDFLLPPDVPPPPEHDLAQRMSYFFNQSNRSGPALERNTPMGLLLRPYINLADPSLLQLFSNPSRLTLKDKDAAMNSTRAPLLPLRTNQANVVTNLLKGGSEAKSKMVTWLCEALALNAGAQASNPDPNKVSSLGTRFNLTALLLNLSGPFVGDVGKEAKISKDSSFTFDSVQSQGAFPSDLALLQAPDAVVATPPNEGAPAANFISQCFFLTWRSLNLSLVQQLDAFESHIRRLSYYHHHLVNSGRDPAVDPQLNQMHQRLLMAEVSLFDSSLLENTFKFIGTASRWLLARIQEGTMPSLPSHFLDDLLLIVIGVSKRCPSALLSANNPGIKGTASPLSSLFDMAVGFLTQPDLVHSPHLRARLGELLYEVYLETSAKPGEHGPRHAEAPHHHFLRNHPRAVSDLAPALLALYGSVEHVSEEERVNCRVHCARLLKYLWGASSAHRATFRRISADHDKFVRFANGLMNETNAYVAQIMEKLLDVRAVQVRMANSTQWTTLSQEERDEELKRHAGNEQTLRSFLPLCNETIHTVSYLSSDKDIRTPFLLPALLDRLSSMLLSVLVQLVGAKGLDIKVDNPESYDFYPKQMLKEICETIVHFSSSPEFQESVSRSGYYTTHPTVLPKAASTVRKHRILNPDALEALDSLCQTAAQFKVDGDAESSVDAPDHFLDPLLFTVMSDPVRLPMGTVIDRVTIEQHLLNDPMDPFSRQPLTVAQLVPEVDLKAEIDAWKAAKQQKK